MGGHFMMATAYLFKELVSEICSFHRIELHHRHRALLYVCMKCILLVILSSGYCISGKLHGILAHNGSNGQIWDRRSSQKYNCMYNFCLQTHQKTNGTNGKVVSQGLIFSVAKNTFSFFTPSKLGKTLFFRAFSLIFQTGVQFFWLMLHIIPVCHFES